MTSVLHPDHLRDLSTDRKPVNALIRILGNWLVIFFAFACLWRFPSPITYILTFLLISVQQHALGLWLHEAIHWLLTKDKKLNDTITRLLLSAPLYVPLEGYRRNHFTHHGYLGSEKDTKQVIFVSTKVRVGSLLMSRSNRRLMYEKMRFLPA